MNKISDNTNTKVKKSSSITVKYGKAKPIKLNSYQARQFHKLRNEGGINAQEVTNAEGQTEYILRKLPDDCKGILANIKVMLNKEIRKKSKEKGEHPNI